MTVPDDRHLPPPGAVGVNTAKPLTTPSQDLDLFRTIAETVSDGVIVTSAELNDPGPRIEYVNPAFTRITGYEPQEILGQTPRILQGPRTDRSTMDRLRAALEHGRTFFGTAINYRKDGTEYVNEWLINPVRNAEGRLLHWVSAQRDVSKRERADASQQILLGELNHRVMNNLAAVQSLAMRLGRSTSSIQEFRTALQERLSALATAQRAIVAAHWQSVSLHSLAQAQLAPFGFVDAGRVEASGPPIHLRAGAAVVLGLALHELGLNALRHGALSAPCGRVGLNWSVVPGPAGDKLCVSWTETGGAAIKPPTRRGFGLRLIEEVLVRELQGEVRISFDPDGVHCLLGAPLSSILDRRA